MKQRGLNNTVTFKVNTVSADHTLWFLNHESIINLRTILKHMVLVYIDCYFLPQSHFSDYLT